MDFYFLRRSSKQVLDLMQISRHSRDAWGVEAIPLFFAEALTDLPQRAERHQDAWSRLYPDPVRNEDADNLRQDWRDHVQPGLERLFATSREIVSADLASLRQQDGGLWLLIPDDHRDAWLNALNQARLVIAEENGFTEQDIQSRKLPDTSTPRGRDLLQMDFYAHLQMLLLETLD